MICFGVILIILELRLFFFIFGDFSVCSIVGVVNILGVCLVEIKLVCIIVVEIVLVVLFREFECLNVIFLSLFCLV